MRRFARTLATALAVGLSLAAPADAGRPAVAALQSALAAHGLYGGFVDGVRGPLTHAATLDFQRRRGLAVDGIPGPQTRRALGWRGRPRLGSRAMRVGHRGWDVAALQYLLQRRGYGPGRADGLFGGLTAAAVLRAQRAVGIAVDGIAGPSTLGVLRRGGRTESSAPDGPVRFLRPVLGPIADGFGAVRSGGRRHQGLDFPVAYGTRIGAAGVGTTIYAGYNDGGYGNLVVVQHRLGYTTWYAHMASITTWVGARVTGGTRLGYVGSTGYSTGPHLHFEVRRYNVPINPLPQLLATVAARSGRVVSRDHNLHHECASARAHRPPARGGSWIARERLCRRVPFG
ncbi:MAG TPA: peptidoglycan-binding protein [Thermoleophilaceae bacterium]|nr:peptidoglycan-binding protein [Thermoleophilaceae bacterium]